MKKVLGLLMFSLLMLTLCHCNGGTGKTETDADYEVTRMDGSKDTFHFENGAQYDYKLCYPHGDTCFCKNDSVVLCGVRGFRKLD